MENPRAEEENIIQNTRNLFRLKMEINYSVIRYITNLYWLEKETKAMKDRILRDIKNLFEHREERNYYKALKVSNF